MITGYIRLHGDFRVVVSNYYYGKSGRGKFLDIFNTMDLNTEHCSSWLQTLTFERRGNKKRKNNEFTSCPFCIHISFDRDIGHYIIKRSILTHKGHVVNQASFSGHASYESDVSDDEKNQLAKFGRMGSTFQNAKHCLIRLFQNRTYDSSLIYRVIKKHRILQFGDSSDFMIKLIDIGNCHKSKGGIFEMTSDKGGRFETLHWSGPYSKLFVPYCSDFLLINGTHKTNIYDLSLSVMTVVDSLGKYVPIGFLAAPFEHSDSINRQKNLLKLIRIGCCDPSSIQSRSIMTDEGSPFVDVASNMDGNHHCLCSFHINQLNVRMSCQIIHIIMTQHIDIISILIKFTFIML